jgi:cell division protease FtsH
MNKLRRPRFLSRPLAALRAGIQRRPRTAFAAMVGVALVLVLVGGSLALSSSEAPVGTTSASFTYSATWSLLDLERHVEAGEVAAISVPAASSDATSASSAGTLAVRTRDGQTVRVDLTVSSADAAAGLAALGHGNLLTGEAWQAAATAPTLSAPVTGSDPLKSIVAILVPGVLLMLMVVVLFRVMRANSGGQRDQGSSFLTVMPAPPVNPATGIPGAPAATNTVPGTTVGGGVRLADVAGCDEAKRELTETIDFLTSPERFRKLGARIPRGTLLFGPPGTGKTMLAKAVATEAAVPFVYASGSEFVEKYVGVGARRVRDLFAHARKLGRAVIFFDEFDAVAKARGGANSHEEREQTLNQLLIELDGFSSTDEVVVIAATNRLDVLDPAVLRPGRFNPKIHVGLPDVAGRRDVLAVHAAGKPLAIGTDLEGLARKTYGFSGAQLADVLNEAAILAARREADVIGPDDLHGGWLKVAVGTGRRRSMDERERSIIAAHEVGHAICGRVHGDKRKVEEISLFAHGEALGVTVSSQEDNDLPAESDLRARLVALMGGRAAEELLFHEVTGGASNDFDKANQIATTMVTRWGMGRDPEAAEVGTSGRGSLGFLVAHGSGSLPSEVQPAATRAIRHILDEAYEQSCETLLEHMTTLRRIAAHLVEEERVDGETFDALFDGTLEVPNAEGEWRPQASRPRAWTDIAPYRERRRPVLVPSLAAATAATPDLSAAPAPLPDPASAPSPGPIAGSEGVSSPLDHGYGEPSIDGTGPVGAGELRRPGRRRFGRPSVAGPAVGARVAGRLGGRTAGKLGGRIERRLRYIALGTLARAEDWLAGPTELEER